MLAKVFWTFLALDALAALTLWVLFQKGTHGLLVILYFATLALIAGAALLFAAVRSDGWRLAAAILFLLPSVPLIFYSGAALFKTISEQRQFNGTAYFSGPALALSQACINQDSAAVARLIPAAGDLNQPHSGGVSLWQFAVLQSNESDESEKILRTLIAAGADPRRDNSPESLEHAIARGPRLTRLLLKAGANPNLPAHDTRPVWMRAMRQAETEEETELLTLMLDHGAKFDWRDTYNRGPVGIAIANRHWYTAALLIERGAPWQSEQPEGGTVPELLDFEILRREEYPIPVPDVLRKALARVQGVPYIPVAAPKPKEGDVNIPDLLREVEIDKLDTARAAVARLAQRPDWARRVAAFFEDDDTTKRNHVALVLSLQPATLPLDLQERCWKVVREQLAWYVRANAASPREPHGRLLREPAAIASALATIPGPARDRNRPTLDELAAHIEACRKANDPATPRL